MAKQCRLCDWSDRYRNIRDHLHLINLYFSGIIYFPHRATCEFNIRSLETREDPMCKRIHRGSGKQLDVQVLVKWTEPVDTDEHLMSASQKEPLLGVVVRIASSLAA